LEEQVQNLHNNQSSPKTHVLAVSVVSPESDLLKDAPLCSLRDKAIQEFLDGAGI
jgi:serine O-acetyltransferase